MIELHQTEWCPHSRRVRQRLTELGVPYVAVPVPAERADRTELLERTGTDEIPVLVWDDGTAVTEDADTIIAALDERFGEPPGAEEHRRKLAEH